MNFTASSNQEVASTLIKSNARYRFAKEIKKSLFHISPTEVSTIRRRFQVDDQNKQDRIESIGTKFLEGYHAAIESDSLDELHQRLANICLDYQGFAYEGAAMGIGLVDRCMPWKPPLFPTFLLSELNHYPYLTHVGLGWSLARLPGAIKRFSKTLIAIQTVDTKASSMNSILGCLVIDGYGFHQSYFDWEKYVQRMYEPNSLPPQCLPVFNQGVGRSLCFVLGMDVDRIAHTIQRFSQDRQADLWSGVGLAAAYAGGISLQEIERLKQHKAIDSAAFAQGVAFAAKARLGAGHIPDHTHLLCRAVWEQSTENVSKLTDLTLDDLPLTSPLAAYAIWRQRIQQAFVAFSPS